MVKRELEQIMSGSDVDRMESAIAEYEKEYPDDYDIFSYKFIFYLNKERIDEAYSIASKAVEVNPFSIEANYNMAYVAGLNGDCAVAYEYYARVIFFQEFHGISITDQREICGYVDNIVGIAKEDETLLKKIGIVNRWHDWARLDIFKEYDGNVIGQNVYLYNKKLYYVGMTDNWIDTYFDNKEKFNRDSYRIRCELFETDSITDIYEVSGEGDLLLPICLNYKGVKDKDYNGIVEAKNRDSYYIEPGRYQYSYFPVAPGDRMATKFPAVFAKPLPLNNSDSEKRKRLVLNIFIDSLNYTVIKGEMLEKYMPNTADFFRKGMICSNYYAGSEHTLPSIATYWTGKHSPKHMNLNEHYRFDFMKGSKGFAGYFKDEGYVTAKIGGNDAVTPFQGYIKGIDRFVYQYSSQGYRAKEVVMDALQHMETFSGDDMFLWLDFVDLHDVAGGFARSINVQSHVPLINRTLDNEIISTVKQNRSYNKEHVYKYELGEVDFYLGILYDYILKNYSDDEIIVSFFSDHGTAFMVDDDKEFMSGQRVNVPLMLRGAGIDAGICDEIIESADYAALICHLAGIDYDYSGTDARLPRIFGGDEEREYAVAHNIFIGDPYRGAIHGKGFHYYYETESATAPEFKIDISRVKSYMEDDDGNIIDDKELLEKYGDVIYSEIKHLVKYF